MKTISLCLKFNGRPPFLLKGKASPLQDSQSIIEVMSYGCHYCAISEKEIKPLDEPLPAGVKVTRIHLNNVDNSGLATLNIFDAAP